VDCTATPVAEGEGETPLLVELAPLDRHLRISREDALIAQHAPTGCWHATWHMRSGTR